ncbi:MAG: MFS transporter [Gaiellaceae bacterium MAG52_C11]|nr:MFS transporter [Candidatus Gaiellasilicea maunaloa]
MPSSRAWLPLALLLVAVGWGANQFAPLLLVYRDTLDLSDTTRAAAFGVYAAGLVPGLLLGGPASDRFGRRRLVGAGALLSALASIALVVGSLGTPGLFAGRLLAGVASGVVFSAGGAWMTELSRGAAPGTGARRAAVAMTLGFGGGPLVAGFLAELLPAPDVLPYVVHLALMAVVIPLARRIPETVAARSPTAPRIRLRVPEPARSAFWLTVAPMAPWVFALPTIAFAALPAEIGEVRGLAIAYSGAITAIGAFTGVLVQPVGRRFGEERGAALGLALGVAGLVVAMVAVTTAGPVLLVIVSLLLGCGYGLCLTAGLRLIETLALPAERGALTGIYYALTYVGFAAPFLVAAAASELDYPVALGGTALLAALTAVWLLVRAAHPVGSPASAG